MVSVTTQVRGVRKLDIEAIKALLPRILDEVLPEEEARLEEMRRTDGAPDWVMFGSAVETIMAPYNEFAQKWGDVPWGGTCTVASALKVGIYSMPRPICRQDNNLYRGDEHVGSLVFGKTYRMNGPHGWDKYKEAIAGAVIGWSCNFYNLVAWLKDPPTIPNSEAWKIPKIGVVPLSAVYKYSAVVPAPVLTTSYTVVTPTTEKGRIYVSLWDSNRNTLAEEDIELEGNNEYFIINNWLGIPFVPQQGFLEITPYDTEITVKDVNSFPPSL